MRAPAAAKISSGGTPTDFTVPAVMADPTMPPKVAAAAIMPNRRFPCSLVKMSTIKAQNTETTKRLKTEVQMKNARPVQILAVALETQKIYEERKILDHVRAVTPLFLDELRSFADHPLVGEVRVVGLIGALELVKDKAKRQSFPDPGEGGVICRDLCIANGLVMRAVRDTMIIAPPLVITHAQIDELVEKARAALDQTRDELQRTGRF